MNFLDSPKIIWSVIAVMAFLIGILSYLLLKTNTENTMLKNHRDKYCHCYVCEYQRKHSILGGRL